MEGILSEQNLNDERYSVLVAEEPGSNRLIVAFGGLRGYLALPVFEFFGTIGSLKTNRIFIRDLDQSWYTRGIRGVSTDIPTTAEFLRDTVGRYGRDRTLFLGNSAGGYASLLFGRLLGVDVVIASSPQTFLGRWLRKYHGDARFSTEIERLNGTQRKYFDLKGVFRKNRAGNTRFEMYFDPAYKVDAIHCNRMRFPGVTLHPYPEAGHSVIRRLRDDGTLIPIIQTAVLE